MNEGRGNSVAMRGGVAEVKMVNATDHLRPGMDPNYRSLTSPYSWDRPAPTAPPRRMQVDFIGWVQQLRDEHEAQFNADLRRRWQMLPAGQRIRLLRTVTSWTQGRAAVELGITRRTLIRHEQGQHRRPWMRVPLTLRLRELETQYADQIIAYLDYRGPERP